MRKQLKRFWRFVQRENLHRIAFILGGMLVASSVAIAIVEPGTGLINGLWWTIVTMTTVGYGDISPTSLGGRLIGVVIMFFGIGLLGMLSATLASVLVQQKLLEGRGLKAYNFTNHIILIEWNYRTRSVLRTLRIDPKTAEKAIVLISDIGAKPVDDDKLFFIQGAVDDDVLQRANLAGAHTLVILGDDRLDPVARDAKVVLSTLTVQAINPDVYTIVELANDANARHCQRASADEIIVTSDVSSGLLARAALDHGITKVFSEWLSPDRGDELYQVPLPKSMVGQTFVEILGAVKSKYEHIVVGVQRQGDSEVLANPPGHLVLAQTDQLIVVAKRRPEME